MSVKYRVILITLVVWLVGMFLYAYEWVRAAISDPGVASYERNGLLPLLGFIMYRGVYIFVGGLLLILIEMILFETLFRKSVGDRADANPRL